MVVYLEDVHIIAGRMKPTPNPPRKVGSSGKLSEQGSEDSTTAAEDRQNLQKGM